VEQDVASRFRSCGLDVAVPDLDNGKRTESLDDGFQIMAEIGWPVICRRAFKAMGTVPEPTILAGLSMGAGVIACLSDERPQSNAALLFHGLSKVPRNVRSGAQGNRGLEAIYWEGTEAAAK
jgi:pimeloyl-ACP methyl ester carboxylesterase